MSGRFIYVYRKPSRRFVDLYEYYRSDKTDECGDCEIFDTWSDAYDAGGSGSPYVHPVGYDWEAVTVDEADRVWPAIDGREGDGGFEAAFSLAAELGDESVYDGMDDYDFRPSSYAWNVLSVMSKAHAEKWRAEKNGGRMMS